MLSLSTRSRFSVVTYTAVFGLTLLAALLNQPQCASATKQATIDDSVEFNDDFEDEVPVTEEPLAAPNKKTRNDNKHLQVEPGGDTSAGEESQSTKGSGTGTVPPGPTSIFDGVLEIVAGTGLLLYVLTYGIGRARNASGARKWHDECNSTMSENFAEVGIPSQQTTLIVESANEYALYGSGRKNCKSMTALMTYPTRHDLLETMMNLVAAPEADVLTITFDLLPEHVHGFVFAVVPTRLAKKLKQDFEDLNRFAQTYNGSTWGLPNDMSVITDAVSVVPQIMTGPMVSFLTAYKTRLVGCHYSDFYMGMRETNLTDAGTEPWKDPSNSKAHFSIKFSFNPLHEEDPSTDAVGALKGSLITLDVIAGVDFRSQAKKDCQKKRNDFIASATAEDVSVVRQRAEQVKQDRLRAERERYEAMDVDNPARIQYEKQQAKKKERKEKQQQMKRGMMAMRR